ncbi:MAG: hypothetical protein FWC51_04065 [Proteobacteria bacterium]|nr:hypothetical protein [Pseudomonadota bacterium]
MTIKVNFGSGIKVRIGSSEYTWNGRKSTLNIIHEAIKNQYKETKTHVLMMYDELARIYYKGKEQDINIFDSKLRSTYFDYVKERNKSYTVDEYLKYFEGKDTEIPPTNSGIKISLNMLKRGDMGE